MDRQMHYVICDTEGRPVTPEEAKAIIAERWTVPAEVRARQAEQEGAEGPLTPTVHEMSGAGPERLAVSVVVGGAAISASIGSEALPLAAILAV